MIKPNLIKGYKEWFSKWTPPIEENVFTYISHHTNPKDLLVLSNLLFPEYLTKDRILFIKGTYNEETYRSLLMKENYTFKEIQKAMNTIIIYDLFAHFSDHENNEEMYLNVGKTIKSFWEVYFNHKYPDIKVVVNLIDNENNYGPIIEVYQSFLF